MVRSAYGWIALWGLLGIGGMLHPNRLYAARPTPRPAARTTAPFALPNDPLWHQAQKRLASARPQLRWKAIRWLSQQQHPAAEALLRGVLRHKDAQTRGWAAAALRLRTGEAIVKALLPLLKDVEVVRLNAVLGLAKNQRLDLLLPHLKDNSQLIREAICKAFAASPKAAISQAPLRQCLQDTVAFVRIGVAEALAPHASQLPADMARTVQVILLTRNRPRRPRTTHHTHAYNAQWRLESIRRTTQSYLRNINYQLRNTNSWLDTKLRACLRRHRQALLGQSEQLVRWETDTIQFTRAGQTREAQIAFSRALLTFRAIQTIYQKAYQCRTKYPSYRASHAYRDILRNAIIEPDSPPFFSDKRRFSLRLATRLIIDSAFDNLRLDLHPYRTSPGFLSSGPYPEIIPGVSVDLSARIPFGRTPIFVFEASNRATGYLLTTFSSLSGFEDQLRLALLLGSKRNRRSYLFFFEEKLNYTQNIFEWEGHPEEFSGPRLVQEFRAGGSLRWGKLRRRWNSRDEWRVHISLRNQIIAPLLEQLPPVTWSPRVNFLSTLSVEKQLFILYMGARGELEFNTFFDNSSRVPTFQASVWLTMTLGDPYNPTDIRLESGVGYGFVSPFLNSPIIPAPNPNQAREHSEPLIYVGFVGHLPNLPIQWSLKYWHRMGPPVRPPFAMYIEDRFTGELRWGVPYELQTILPRHMQISAGLDIRVVNYGHPQEKDKNAPPTDALDPNARMIRDVTIFAKFSYPIWRGLRFTVQERFSFLRNEFVPYRTEKQKPNYDIVRNILLFQIEYWFGGE